MEQVRHYVEVDQLRRVELDQLNPSLACPVCRGYLIDCVTAEECGHTYCRSCIMRHISNGVMTCPQCHQYFNPEEPGEPFHKLRQDHALQRLVYKLVPGLLSKETERRGEYLNSEQEARTQIRQSAEGDALFFNERSKISIQLRKRFSSASNPQAKYGGNGEKLFLRAEMSTPLSVIGDYLRLRMQINSKCRILLSEDATSTPLPESFRIIELAYLTKWDKMHPLAVYYEPVIDSSSNHAGFSPASTSMLSSQSPGAYPQTSSNRPSASSKTSSSGSRSPHKSQSDEAASKLKMRLTKNHVGGWRLTSNARHHRQPIKTISPVVRRSAFQTDKPPILLNFGADVIKSTRIAKVRPLPVLPNLLDFSSALLDEGELGKDPAASLLYNTGLVPNQIQSQTTPNSAPPTHLF